MLKSFFTFIFLILGSWALVHILAFTGVFIAVVYPIWMAAFPNLNLCLICRLFPQEDCKYCVSASNGNYSGSQRFKCILANIFLIIFFSAVSVGVVFGESYTLYKLGIFKAEKTVSFSIPKKNQHRIGEIFGMDIEIIGVSVPINAVQADISFDPDILRAVEVTTDASFATIFVQKEIDNDAGFVRLTGGVPNPGYFSDRGVFGTVLFQGIAPGTVEVEFLHSSLVLANDGRGTNVIKSLPKVSYLILPEKLPEDEMELQISFYDNVLAASSRRDQMFFYEEGKDSGNVLGLSTITEGLSDVSEPLKDRIADLIYFIDSSIINFWKKLYNRVI